MSTFIKAFNWLDIHVGIPCGWWLYKWLYCYANTPKKLLLMRLLLWATFILATDVLLFALRAFGLRNYVIFVVLCIPFSFIDTSAKLLWKQMRH